MGGTLPWALCHFLVDWGGQHHPLCLVSALCQYMDATSQASYLFVWPTSLAPRSKQHTAQLVCWVTDLADLGRRPTSWDVWQVGVLVNYLHHFSEDHVRRAGQWSSSFPFCTCYHSSHLHNVPCVAMGSLPQWFSPVPSSFPSSFLMLSYLMGKILLCCFMERIMVSHFRERMLFQFMVRIFFFTRPLLCTIWFLGPLCVNLLSCLH